MIKHPVTSEAAQNFIDNEYHDRGMMKWQGFMLSDHKAYMEKQANKTITKLEQQDRNTILNYLNQSYAKHTPIIIQFNYLENDIPVELKDVVVVFNEDTIALKRNDEEFEIDAIRNIRLE